MQRFSISQLSKLTGFDRRTVTNRLDGQTGEKQGRSITYTVRQLIDGITIRRAEQAEVLNLEQERARLAKEQRRKLEHERAVDEAELLDSQRVLSDPQGAAYQSDQSPSTRQRGSSFVERSPVCWRV